MRTRARILGGVLVPCLVAIWPAAPAAAQPTTVVTPSVEAWYQPNPSCAQPTGCLGPTAPTEPPLSPFPSGTLHVGSSAGEETARSYLALPLAAVLGKVTAATLEVPLDTAPDSGSQRPESATLQVCPFVGKLEPVEGSVDSPPRTSCETSVRMSYVALPEPHLYANLTPLLPGLLSDSGIVLLPRPGSSGSASLWRVVFSAHTRESSIATPPAKVSLTLADDGTDSPGDVESTPPGPPSARAPRVTPATGTGFAPAPRTIPSPEPAPAPQVAADPATTAVRLRVRPPVRGYAYPGVWLFPLALLVLVPLTATALARDLTPASPRESAAS